MTRTCFIPVSYTHLDVYKRQEEQGILEKGKEGTVTLTRTPEQVEELVDSQQWKQLFGEEEAKRRSTGSSQETEEKMQVIRRIQKEKRNNPGVNAITIDQKLVYEETEHHIKTRIPYLSLIHI